MDYSNLKIYKANRKKEYEIIMSINQCLDYNNSFVFEAGAGSGKTYTLIENLKHLIINYNDILKINNQKIICITYTNVAAKEILDRLGNTNIVEVSTIHSWLWTLIENQQSALLKIHLKKLKNEIKKANEFLETNLNAKFYREYSNKEQIKKILLDNENTYYSVKSLNAQEFKRQMNSVSIDEILLKNVENFKKVADKLLRINNFQNAIDNVEKKENKYKKVKYDSRFNNDSLHNMRISHDTLIEYTNEIITEYDLLKKIISHKYPYILIDEYQDTDPKVVEILSNISTYSENTKHKSTIGYYGDKRQNIYDTGVGDNLKSIHINLQVIQKEFNRRSSEKIIEIANKIRKDDLEQKTIYEDFPEGEVNFYCEQIDKNKIIEFYKKKWKINQKNKLHCFELTNEGVAKAMGLEEIYNFFKKSPYYTTGMNFNLVNQETLNNDLTKLGKIQNMIFKIIDFKEKISNTNSRIQEVISDETKSLLTKENIKITIDKLKTLKKANLFEFLEELKNLYKKGDDLYDNSIKNILESEIFNIENIIKDKLFKEKEDISDAESDTNNQTILEFLKLDMDLYTKWYKFISEISDEEIIYHTYHSTKGREFDNVIIFMENKFGKNKKFFERYFEKIETTENIEKNEDGKKILSAKNLFYVAVTRATKNLTLVYADTLSKESENNIKNIFGEIKKFNSGIENAEE